MSKVTKLDDSFKKTFILRFVQILGLRPYTLADGRRSIPLSVYNVTVAVLVFVNAYLTRKDRRNDANYNNVTILIEVAYAAVDFFGNLYICCAMVRTPLAISASISAWRRLRAVDRQLSFRFLFDYERMRSYTCIKLAIVFVVIVIFTTNEVISCIRLNLYLTIGYYISSLLPLFYTFFVAILFGCAALVLFQRYWVVNKVLQDLADNMTLRFSDFSASISTSQNWCRPRLIPKEAFDKSREPPTYVMLKCKKENTAGEENLLKKIRMLREIHFELYELINEFNSSFGFHFLFQFIFFFFGCTINIYYVITFHLRPYELEQYLGACFWSILLLFLASYVVFHSNLIINEAQRTTEMVHLFLTRAEFCDTRIQHELNSFSSQLMQCPIHIKAGGFFEVNSSLLFQFLTGILSSVVFVVQFDKVNFGR